MVGCGVSIFAVCAAAAASIGLSWLKRRMRDVHAALRTRRVPSGKSVERTVEKPHGKGSGKSSGKRQWKFPLYRTQFELNKKLSKVIAVPQLQVQLGKHTHTHTRTLTRTYTHICCACQMPNVAHFPL